MIRVLALAFAVIAITACGQSPDYQSVTKAVNARCAPYGGVQSVGTTPNQYIPGTVVCKDGVARDYTTRIK